MKKPLILITAIALAWGLQAQRHYDAVLAQVEQASPLLLAARQQSEAARLQARTGYLLPNPEVEMATYKGFPAEAGNRIDLQVSQTFELPSVLVRRSRLRRLAEQAATLDYLTLRNTLLREVQSACADLVYYQQVHALYARRHAQSEQLVNAYQTRLEQGDCSILDYNRLSMSLSLAASQERAAERMIDQTVAELKALGCQLSDESRPATYGRWTLPLAFGPWYDSVEMNTPDLRSRALLVDTRTQELQLSRSLWLPELSVGYTSETVTGEAFRGISVGLTLPLWSQWRAVKGSSLALTAARQELEAERLSHRCKAEALYNRILAMQHDLADLQTAYQGFNSQQLLDRALQAGELSIEQYLIQVDYYMEQELHLCTLAHDLEQSYLDLFSLLL